VRNAVRKAVRCAPAAGGHREPHHQGSIIQDGWINVC
jgi:hypothetical protein